MDNSGGSRGILLSLTGGELQRQTLIDEQEGGHVAQALDSLVNTTDMSLDSWYLGQVVSFVEPLIFLSVRCGDEQGACPVPLRQAPPTTPAFGLL